MSTPALVCPSCKSGDHLISIETAAIGYPVRFNADGEVDYDVDRDRETYDEGTQFEDLIICRNCFGYTELTLADLVPEEES